MMVPRIFFSLVFWLIPVTGNSLAEIVTPTHYAKMDMPVARYDELLEPLDAIMKRLGFIKYSGHPGLNQLKHRNVLYIDYRHPKSKGSIVLLTDQHKEGTVWVIVYSSQLNNEKIRKELILKIGKILEQLGARLTTELPKSLRWRQMIH